MTNSGQSHADHFRLVDENAAAKFLGFSVRALQNWRVRGGGPPFIRVSARAIRYRIGDLIQWAEERRVYSTSEPLRT